MLCKSPFRPEISQYPSFTLSVTLCICSRFWRRSPDSGRQELTARSIFLAAMMCQQPKRNRYKDIWIIHILLNGVTPELSLEPPAGVGVWPLQSGGAMVGGCFEGPGWCSPGGGPAGLVDDWFAKFANFSVWADVTDASLRRKFWKVLAKGGGDVPLGWATRVCWSWSSSLGPGVFSDSNDPGRICRASSCSFAILALSAAKRASRCCRRILSTMQQIFDFN